MEVEHLIKEGEAARARLTEAVRKNKEAEARINGNAACLRELQISLNAKERELAACRETNLVSKMDAEQEILR